MMRRLGRLALPMLLALAALLGAASPTARESVVVGVRGDSSDVSRALTRVLDDYWRHQLDERTDIRITHGLRVERLPDLSFAHGRRELAFTQSLLRRLDTLNTAALDHSGMLSLQTLRWELARVAEGAKFSWLNFGAITPYSTPLRTAAQAFSAYRFDGTADLDRYLSLLRSYPALADTIRGGLEARRRRGLILPRDEIDLVLPLLRSYARPPDSSLFAVTSERLAKVDSSRVGEFQKEVADVIATRVNPSLDRLVKYLAGRYRDDAPATVGLGQYPGGKEYYRYLVRLHTTLQVTPEEVHQIGLEEVARLDTQMAAVRARLGFTGTQAEFHRMLKRDGRFFAATPDEIGERLMSHERRIQPLLPAYFGRLPRSTADVRRLDPRLESVMTFGYYQVPTATDSIGHYFYNGSKLRERNLLFAAALVFHELDPGHHFQFALQAENASLPAFRREAAYTAFTEGWGEYASSLAGEMGMYDDAYDRYGRLMMDMFISCRLVVDTGMNYFGWSRARAMEFMRERLLDSETQLNTETLRYSVDLPGQALAYKMGSRKLIDLRDRARTKLGDRFDYRTFHDAILRTGAMPLTIVEANMARFVTAND
jgi:uncharacterized protein (DUF885 family)